MQKKICWNCLFCVAFVLFSQGRPRLTSPSPSPGIVTGVSPSSSARRSVFCVSELSGSITVVPLLS